MNIQDVAGVMWYAMQLVVMQLSPVRSALPVQAVLPMPALKTAPTAARIDTLHPPVLPAGGYYTPLGDTLKVQGQAILAWLFEAPLPVADLARWLTQHQPALRDMWVMPGSTVLAGVEGSTHWAARLLEVAPGATRGTISAMSLENSLNKDAPEMLSSTLWQRAGGRLQFEWQLHEDGHPVVQQIWIHDLAPPELWKVVKRDLDQQGWHATWKDDGRQAGQHDAQIFKGPFFYTGSRAGVHVSIVIVGLAQGSGVTLMLRNKE